MRYKAFFFYIKGRTVDHKNICSYVCVVVKYFIYSWIQHPLVALLKEDEKHTLLTEEYLHHQRILLKIFSWLFFGNFSTFFNEKWMSDANIVIVPTAPRRNYTHYTLWYILWQFKGWPRQPLGWHRSWPFTFLLRPVFTYQSHNSIGQSLRNCMCTWERSPEVGGQGKTPHQMLV